MTKGKQLDLFHSPMELERMKFLTKRLTKGYKKEFDEKGLISPVEAELQLLKNKIK